MPALKNQRHEAFAVNIVAATKTKMTNGQCYSASGYAAQGNAAEANASRLLSDARNGVAARVQELMNGGAKAAKVTIASLLGELEQARAGAHDAAQFSAAAAATLGKAKLAGLLVDKQEIGGVGDFSRLETVEDVARVFLEGTSTEDALMALQALTESVHALAASRAKEVASTPDARVAFSEADRSLALFRSTKSNGRHR